MKKRASRYLKKVRQYAQKHRKELLLVGIILGISFFAHAWNMFSYPYFENDEATYSSRAWSFMTSGELDVYTYRYDHAPLGWIVIGFWYFLTGGLMFFDNLLVSGRVLMLLVHLVSVVVVYLLAKRLSGGSKFAGAIAALVFTLSPLGIYFQRRILLDNLMTLAFLGSLLILTKKKLHLKHYISSGALFGASVLIKLNAIFLGPVFILMIWLRAKRHHRAHAISHWVAYAGLVVSLFFLYALLKGELFSAPIGADGLPEHVSVVDTFKLQLGRGDFYWPWEQKSSFMQALNSWQLKDGFTLFAGAIATAGLTIISIIKRKQYGLLSIVAATAWLYLLFLTRGKLVLDLYVTPLIPIFAINIGLFAWVLIHKLPAIARKASIAGIVISGALIYGALLPHTYLTKEETNNQQQAVAWIRQHVPKDSVIVTDNYLYPEISQQSHYSDVLYFFNAEYDPEARQRYEDDWRNIDYVVATHELMEQIKSGQVPTMKQTFDHADLVASFTDGSSSFLDLKNYISTNGDWVQIYKVKSRNEIVLEDSWKHFRSAFIRDYGQIIDTNNNEISTSYDQALAMRQALQQNDQPMFEGVWQWSKDHLQYRQNDKLLSWLWKPSTNGEYSLGDSNTVCAADQQTALLLFQAGEKWQTDNYEDDAQVAVSDWWKKCTFQSNGKLHIRSSADGAIDTILINPGYFDPVLYRSLKAYVPGFDWDRLISDQYEILNTLDDKFGTIPNWALISPQGQYLSATSIVGAGADRFGPDSLLLVDHLLEEYAVSQDEHARDLLGRLDKDIHAYIRNNPESYQGQTIQIVYAQLFDTGDTPQALYEQYIFRNYDQAEGMWGEGTDYNQHIWSWRWHEYQQLITNDNVRIQ